jgi:hypothetical protein
LEELRSFPLPWYLQIKFFHLLMVAMWSFSTAVAFRDYPAPVFRAWSRNPERHDLVARRDEAIERFDNGAVLEHIAFPPMEILDYYLSHFGGNKGKIRTACNTQRYEQMILLHWKFLRVSTPLVIVFIPAIFTWPLPSRFKCKT